MILCHLEVCLFLSNGKFLNEELLSVFKHHRFYHHKEPCLEEQTLKVNKSRSWGSGGEGDGVTERREMELGWPAVQQRKQAFLPLPTLPPPTGKVSGFVTGGCLKGPHSTARAKLVTESLGKTKVPFTQ